jgi:hypothetical protein
MSSEKEIISLPEIISHFKLTPSEIIEQNIIFHLHTASKSSDYQYRNHMPQAFKSYYQYRNHMPQAFKSDYVRMDEGDGYLFASLVTSNNFPELRSITLKRHQIGDSTLAYICDALLALPHLEELNVSMLFEIVVFHVIVC